MYSVVRHHFQTFDTRGATEFTIHFMTVVLLDLIRPRRDVSVRDASYISYLFCFQVKFSDEIVRLLYPFLVADMTMQLL